MSFTNVNVSGATGDHVIISCYSSDLEDFAGSDMTYLDTWVFSEVKVTAFFPLPFFNKKISVKGCVSSVLDPVNPK